MNRAMRGPRATLGVALGLVVLQLAGCSDSSSPKALDEGKNRIEPSVAVAEDAPWTPLVTSLVQAMTLSEKLSMVEGASVVGGPVRGTGQTNGVSRLGIPVRYDADALGIYATGTTTTSPPVRLAMASSFDRAALQAAGAFVGTEGLAAGSHVVYGPHLDIAAIPNWSRNETAPGEDPYLTSELGAYEVNGIQGAGLMANVKHVALYDGWTANTMFGGSGKKYVQIDDQTAHEIYLEAFRKALSEAQASSEMCSYDMAYVPGVMAEPKYACHNNWLNNVVIHGQWGWQGFILSDYGAVHAGDIQNGLDQEFSSTYLGATNATGDDGSKIDASTNWYNTIASYADRLQALDGSVARILYQYERFGLLKCASASGAVAGCDPTSTLYTGGYDGWASDWAVSQSLAEEGMVLLKNAGGVLPITATDTASGGGVLVIGPTARQLMNATGERSKGFPARSAISPLQKLQELAGSGAKITYLPAIDWVGTVIGASGDATAAAHRITTTGYQVTDTDANAAVTSGTAASIDGHQVPPGGKTSVTAEISVPTAGSYTIWLRGRTLTAADAANTGNLSAHYAAFGTAGSNNCFVIPGVGTVCMGGTPASASAALKIDDVDEGLSAPPVQPETFWSVDGYVSYGATVTLAAGTHTLQADFDTTDLDPSEFPDGLHVKISYASPDADRAAAVAAAASASKVIFFANTGGTAASTDSTDVIARLDKGQDDLIAAIAAVNSKTAVVLGINNPVAMPWLSAVSGVLVAWYPGQEGGTAEANVLLGNANPGGRLPITFPARTEDTPYAGANYSIRVAAGNTDADGNAYSDETQGIFVGYRWYDRMGISPMFAFGEGLSYTTFEYSGLKLTETVEGFQATFTVKNTGAVAGAVVPQLYVGATDAVLPDGVQQAKKKLVGFDRVTLAAGKSATVTMTVDSQQLSYWSTDLQDWVRPSGTRAVYVSDSSRDSAIKLKSTFTVN